MAVYRFRISFEEHDEVTRDIEIRSDQTFDDLNKAIQASIGFDGSKSSSFYMSNDQWKKGQEITDRDLSEDDPAIPLQKAVLNRFIVDPHQKIYHVFDPASHWTFYIELKKITGINNEPDSYPVCVNSVGDAPKQYTVIEPHKGASKPVDQLENEIQMVEEDEEDAGDNNDEAASMLGEMIDEGEYDNIDDRSGDDHKE